MNYHIYGCFIESTNEEFSTLLYRQTLWQGSGICFIQMLILPWNFLHILEFNIYKVPGQHKRGIHWLPGGSKKHFPTRVLQDEQGLTGDKDVKGNQGKRSKDTERSCRVHPGMICILPGLQMREENSTRKRQLWSKLLGGLHVLLKNWELQSNQWEIIFPREQQPKFDFGMTTHAALWKARKQWGGREEKGKFSGKGKRWWKIDRGNWEGTHIPRKSSTIDQMTREGGVGQKRRGWSTGLHLMWEWLACRL